MRNQNMGPLLSGRLNLQSLINHKIPDSQIMFLLLLRADRRTIPNIWRGVGDLMDFLSVQAQDSTLIGPERGPRQALFQ